MHRRLGSATVTAGIPREKQSLFPMREILLGQHSCKKYQVNQSDSLCDSPRQNGFSNNCNVPLGFLPWKIRDIFPGES